MSSDHKRPHDDDLTEADRVLHGLYDRAREPIAWDESDDAILAAARDAKIGAATDDDLDPADKVLLELYERGKETIPWDDSDDAILAAAREASAANDDAPPASATNDDDLGDNVVRFPASRVVRRVLATPGAGWAIAASVMVGVFVGQGSTPYLHLGIGPDVPGLLQENVRLGQEVADSQSEITRLNQQFSETGIRFTDDGAPAGAPADTAAAAPAGEFAALGQVLDQFECAALSATLRGGADLTINGHVSSADDMNRLLASLAPFAGVAQVSNQAQIYAWPHCEAVEIVDQFTAASTAAAAPPSIRPFQHGAAYREGEALVVEATAGATAGYLYVDFIQNDGTVVHLMSGTQVAPGTTTRLGDSDLTFTIAPPFGEEMLLVVQTAEPLFADTRPQVEQAADYLPSLRAALATATAQSAFTFLSTSAAE